MKTPGESICHAIQVRNILFHRLPHGLQFPNEHVPLFMHCLLPFLKIDESIFHVSQPPLQTFLFAPETRSLFPE